MRKQRWFRVLSCCLMVVLILASGLTSVAAAPPAPVLISPSNGSTIVEPALEWQAVNGAAYYKVELSISPTFVPIAYTYNTYNTRIIPVGAIDNTTFYWRVSGVDAGDNVGTPSAYRSFIKNIPAPVLVSPANGSTLSEPVLEWQAAVGAAYYQVELSTSPNFVTLDHTYLTYNTRVIPTGTIAHTTFYWRVSGVDAEDHVGTASSTRTFTKTISAPVLVGPANSSHIAEPVLEWQAIAGAAYYKVELSTVPTFVPIDHTYTTYNTRVIPTGAIAHTTFYWRVSGVDAEDHVGTPSASRTFIKNIPAPVLISPSNGSAITETTLVWQAVEGAAYYKVELSLVSNFVPISYTYTTYNTRLTPADKVTPNTYYWRVSGVDAEDNVGAASTALTLTLTAMPAAVGPNPLLLAPADGATLTTDPTFQWSRMIGIADYRLVVSKYSDFHPTYDSAILYYASFTPYVGSAGQQWAYPNGIYYWYVEARNGSGTVIATSLARSFTKAITLPLVAPADTALLTTDPTYQWTRVVGAHDFRLVVSKEPDFSPIYDYAYPDYLSFTPYADSAGQHWVYPNNRYYWKVEARDHNGTVIVTSSARSFTKTMTLPLVVPADNALLTTDPTYQWSRVVGAHDFRLVVSKEPDFSPTCDYAYPDYLSFTPYIGSAGQQYAYPNGIYYWKVEARDHSGTVIVTSAARSFTKTMTFPLIAPANGSFLTTDPTYQWSRVVGAHDFRLVVSKEPDFSPVYDYVYPDYLSFTPYVGSAGQHTTYDKGTYYWKVEARDHSGTVIVTSNAWAFTIGFRTYIPMVKKN